MKKVYAAYLCSAIVVCMPLLASAQTVNSSASIQQSFLSQLLSLQQELSSLAATINAMIIAAGGTGTSAAASSASNSSQSTNQISSIPTTLLPTSGLSGDDLVSSLLQAITPASTSPVVVTTSATATSSTATQIQNYATQLDPVCTAGLWGNGAQCGGLYYCTVGVAGGYWSSTACNAVE